MALQFLITDAGRAAIAQVGGAIGPVTLTKIAIGSAGYTPTATRTALQTEIKRLDPSGSSVPVPGTIHLTASDDSTDAYSVKEIGLYTNNNILFAIYSQTATILTKGSTASALFALDFVMTNVPAGTVVVGDAGFSYAQANETRLGVLAIATTAEAQAGTIDTKIITPLKLAQVTATETRRGVIQLATTAEAQALSPDATKALTVARLVDRTATTSRVGVVELADNTETQTGTDTIRAVTPAGLASRTATDARAGLVELATNVETQTGTDATRAVTPASLSSRTATDARAGIVELATNTETQDGTDTTRAVTPAGLFSCVATTADPGLVILASNATTQTGTSATSVVTPAGLSSRTATNARTGIVRLATNLETQTGTDATLAVTPAGLASSYNLFVPAGAVMPFAMNSAPPGWVACNGGQYSKTDTTYAALFAAIGILYGETNGSGGAGTSHFRVPDLRGEFIRGLDSGRGVDLNRQIGTTQADAFKSHAHSVNANSGKNLISKLSSEKGENKGQIAYTLGGTGGELYGLSPVFEQKNTDAAGGTETRPRNVALLYCIKF